MSNIILHIEISSESVICISASPTIQSNLWQDATYFLQFNSTSPYFATMGLMNNTVYDLIAPGNDLVTVQANAMTANISCGCIPNATAEFGQSDMALFNIIYDRYNFTFVGVYYMLVLKRVDVYSLRTIR